MNDGGGGEGGGGGDKKNKGKGGLIGKEIEEQNYTVANDNSLISRFQRKPQGKSLGLKIKNRHRVPIAQL